MFPHLSSLEIRLGGSCTCGIDVLLCMQYTASRMYRNFKHNHNPLQIAFLGIRAECSGNSNRKYTTIHWAWKDYTCIYMDCFVDSPQKCTFTFTLDLLFLHLLFLQREAGKVKGWGIVGNVLHRSPTYTQTNCYLQALSLDLTWMV